MKIDRKGLPVEPPVLQEMLIEALELADNRGRTIEQLEYRLSLLERHVFGRRSEKLDPDQGQFEFDDDESPRPLGDDEGEASEGGDSSEEDETSTKGKGHGRRRLPAHLRRRRVEYHLTPGRRCQCGGELHFIGSEDPASHLEYIPAVFLVWEQVRLKYGCRACGGPVVTGTEPVVVDADALGSPSSAPSPAPNDSVDQSAVVESGDSDEPDEPDEPVQAAEVNAQEPGVESRSITESATTSQADLDVESLPLPCPIDKGLPGPGLLAHMLTSKYGDHLPLYRLEQIYARSGVALARSTLCGWVGRCAVLLEPLWALMVKLILESAVIHTDDTVLPVLDKKLGEARKGRVWVYLGDDAHPHIVYDYTTSRERDGPQAFLKTFRGYLQADAYGGYDGIYKTQHVIEVACLAHARRKYWDAQTKDLLRAQRALAYIGLLYKVERSAKNIAKEQKLSREDFFALRHKMRQEQSRPILQKFREWLDSDAFKGVLPKSAIGKAIGYTRNQWVALNRYLDDGRLEIDNNISEQEMKAIATGRKNWLFAGNDGGARNSAIIYSVVRTCRRHGVDPFAYLRDVLSRLPGHPKDRLRELLPDRWKMAHPQAIVNPLLPSPAQDAAEA